MSKLDQVLEQARQGKIKSVLVSGGCDNRGRVPWDQYLPQLRELAHHSRLNIHTGLIEPGDVENLADIASAVSLDMVGDRETVREVYGLDLEPENWFESYRLLKNRVPVIPHLCAGLRGGKLSGEPRVLEFLSQEDPEMLTIITFIPTPGTAYADCQPPELQQMEGFLKLARQKLPRTHLTLGCMRPGGNYRTKLDVMAIRAGFDGIVQPAPAARELARELGLEVVEGRECCSL
jgi:uncharacterized radical SAM superfamily protein